MKRDEKKIWFLGLSSLFNDIGSEMIALILPFFVTALGGGGIAIGSLSGLREGLASIVKLFSGWYSDKVGKRMPFVFLGYFISVLFRFLLVLSNSWQTILIFMSLERFGKARDAPRDAIISVSTKRYGHGFGIQQMLDTSGAILGSMLVLFLFWKFQLGFKTIILIAASLSIFSLVPLFFVKEPKTKPIKKSLFSGIKYISKELKYFIFVASVFTFANFGLYMLLLLRAKQITGSLITAIALGVLFNFIWAFFTIPFGNLSDIIGRKKVLIIGYALLSFVGLGFIYSSSLIYLIVLFILFGFVYAITQANQRALVSDLSGKMKATAFGFFQFVIGIVAIAGGIIAGFLWNISPKIMFVYITLVAALSTILLLFVKSSSKLKN